MICLSVDICHETTTSQDRHPTHGRRRRRLLRSPRHVLVRLPLAHAPTQPRSPDPSAHAARPPAPRVISDTAPEHAVPSADPEEHEVAANTADPVLTDIRIDEDVVFPRRSSSAYSRDTDGNSLHSTTTTPVQETSSTGTSFETHTSSSMYLTVPNSDRPYTSASMIWPLRSSSIGGSGSSPGSSSATSMSTHETALGAIAGRALEDSKPTEKLYTLVKKGLRAPSISPGSFRVPKLISKHKTDPVNTAPPRPDRHDERPDPSVNSEHESEYALDLEDAVAIMLQRREQQHEPEVLRPPIDRVVELARLRRRIRELDFGMDDEILIASDLTTLVPTAEWERHQGEELVSIAGTPEYRAFFRDRLSRRVQRRLAYLRLHYRGGSVREIEHWYRDVVALVGWRDQAEAQLPWSWRRRNGFF